MKTPMTVLCIWIAALAVHSNSHAQGHSESSCSYRTECNEPALNECQGYWWGYKLARLNELIPGLERERSEVPGKISVCYAEKNSIDYDRSRKELDKATIDGRLGANRTAQTKFNDLYRKVVSQRSLLNSIRPLVETTTPTLILELRTYLESRELELNGRIAELIDEASRTPDPKQRQSLEFQIESLSELRTLREMVGDAGKIRERVSGALSSTRTAEDFTNFSYLTRALLQAAGDAAREYRTGASAFAEFERQFAELQAGIEQEKRYYDSVVNDDQWRLTKVESEISSLQSNANSKLNHCRYLEQRRDGGIAHDIAVLNNEVAHGSERHANCRALYCRSVCR